MLDLTLADCAKALKNKDLSSVELTQFYLNRIDAHDKDINAFISVDHEGAMAMAKAADTRLASGDAALLTGVPIAHKDLLCTKGHRTTCASKMLSNFVSLYDATLVANMGQQSPVMLGKLNMDEFAMGSSNETSYFGAVSNPWDLSRVPGGSSGGSAAAVAARLVPGVTGTDTGGSIRQPAAFCGITGLKPTYGRVSRYGLVAFASSLDQAGPMARNAEDCAYLLQAMAGFDPKDSTSIDRPVDDYVGALTQSLKGKTIGLPLEFFSDELNSDIRNTIMAAVEVLKGQGIQFETISLPNIGLSVPVYYVVASAECSSNLSRFDGVRYGHRCDHPNGLEDLYKRSRGEGFGQEVKRRIMVGAYALSAGYYDAYYLKAQQVRQLIANDFSQAFEKVDFILAPTTPTVAFGKDDETRKNPVEMYLSDIFTIGVNMAGLPGISVPCGFNEALPVGMQLIGPHFSEGALLALAHQYQQETNWHNQTPEWLDKGVA